MVFVSLAELFSVGSIIPFLGIMTEPNIVFKKYKELNIDEYIYFESSDALLLPITICFISAISISAIFRIILVWMQNRVSYGIATDFSINIFSKTLYQSYEVHLSRNSSEVISGIANKASTINDNGIMPSLVIISNTILLSFFFFTLAFFNPVATLCAVSYTHLTLPTILLV